MSRHSVDAITGILAGVAFALFVIHIYETLRVWGLNEACRSRPGVELVKTADGWKCARLEVLP